MELLHERSGVCSCSGSSMLTSGSSSVSVYPYNVCNVLVHLCTVTLSIVSYVLYRTGILLLSIKHMLFPFF